MTDRSGEAGRGRVRERDADEAAVPVASMDVAPELFPTGAAGGGTERGAE